MITYRMYPIRFGVKWAVAVESTHELGTYLLVKKKSAEPILYSFDTEDDAKAFLKEVKEQYNGSGWVDRDSMEQLVFKDVSPEEVEAFKKNWKSIILGSIPAVVGENSMEIKYYSEGVELRYGTDFAAGIDLPFFDPELESYTFKPFERKLLKTGVYMEPPVGYYGQLDTRSSTAKMGGALLCHTIDWDYRGNIRINVINLSNEELTVERGQLLAQMILLPYVHGELKRVNSQDELSSTERGASGFGSTGKNFKETEGGIQG